MRSWSNPKAVESDSILLTVEGGVAVMTLNRPESLNALNSEMSNALVEITNQVEHDPAIRCLLIRGAGSAFMAGGDIKEFSGILDADPETRRICFQHSINGMHHAMISLRRMRKPVVAAVQGAAAGFGLSLVLACDMAIAADNSIYTLAYSQLGTTPDGGGSFFLARTVGMKKAMEIAMLSDRFDAATAVALGIINKTVPADDLDDEAMTLARRLADGPTHALANAKMLINQAVEVPLEVQLQAEADNFADCAATDDFVEAVRAFIDKRKPAFTGK